MSRRPKMCRECGDDYHNGACAKIHQGQGSLVPTADSDERVTFLRQAPSSALVSIIRDYCSDQIGIGQALFMVGMDSRFRKTTSVELFDLIAPILRERILEKSQNSALSNAPTAALKPDTKTL